MGNNQTNNSNENQTKSVPTALNAASRNSLKSKSFIKIGRKKNSIADEAVGPRYISSDEEEEVIRRKEREMESAKPGRWSIIQNEINQ